MSDDFLPYSCQSIDEEDIRAVAEVLRSPVISQGSRLVAFENTFAARTGARFAAGVSSGSAALHAMCSAAGIGSGDEVIVPALTFASTATAILHCGAEPVFVDVDPVTLCIDPGAAEAALTPRTRAILAVDFAGHPAPYDALRAITDPRDLLLLADSAHAVGGSYGGRPIGSIADITAFSFNPVKNMTSAEGGMVTTNDPDVDRHVRMFRVHGMTRDPEILESDSPGGWYYEQQFMGFNYKLSELHAALGLSQLGRLDRFNRRRAEIADEYSHRLADLPFELPKSPPAGSGTFHTWHLYAIQTENADIRAALFASLRDSGIGVQVHYIPVPMHPYFQRLGYTMDGFPVAAGYYERAISLPVHPRMTDGDVQRVLDSLGT